jgi:hypothetical protein
MTGVDGVPETLWEAHELMGRCRPARDADLGDWLKFHQDNVAMYQSLADSRAGHWAARERYYLQKIQQRIKEADQQHS